MPRQLEFDILPQPDDSTCGPTCLHAVYRYYGDDIRLEQVVQEAPMLEEGGTLAVFLGCHALRRGYRARMYTYNLRVFDPTWFHVPVQNMATKPLLGEPLVDRQTPVVDGLCQELGAGSALAGEGSPTRIAVAKDFDAQTRVASRQDLIRALATQMAEKPSQRLQAACRAYMEYLELGGEIVMRDLSASLIRRYLKQATPILTGLSSTYLYRSPREYGPRNEPDDVRGYPVGHFVVLCGYDQARRSVRVADPLWPNPMATDHFYEVRFRRLICSILLGVLTYDANLLIIEPAERSA